MSNQLTFRSSSFLSAFSATVSLPPLEASSCLGSHLASTLSCFPRHPASDIGHFSLSSYAFLTFRPSTLFHFVSERTQPLGLSPKLNVGAFCISNSSPNENDGQDNAVLATTPYGFKHHFSMLTPPGETGQFRWSWLGLAGEFFWVRLELSGVPDGRLAPG